MMEFLESHQFEAIVAAVAAVVLPGLRVLWNKFVAAVGRRLDAAYACGAPSQVHAVEQVSREMKLPGGVVRAAAKTHTRPKK